MTVYICDPGFSRRYGHHYKWNTEFVGLFQKMGEVPYLLAHHMFPEKELAGAPVLSFFKQARGHEENKSDVMYLWDRYHDSNRTIFHQMQQLTAKGIPGALPAIKSGDIVLFTTIMQLQLSGIVDWFAGLEDGQRPTVLCYLMGPSGSVKKQNSDDFSYHCFDTARFYKLAFRTARQALEQGKEGLHFFACGESHAEQYSFLSGSSIDPYPLLNTAIQPEAPVRQEESKKALLFMGSVADRKGLVLVPNIVKAVCAKHPDWQFTVQISDPIRRAPTLEKLAQQLGQLEQHFSNFEFIFSNLDDDTYRQCFNDSEVVLTPYNQRAYLNHTSGLVWEAVATANTLVVPADCWLDSEADRLDAGYVSFAKQDVSSIVDAVSEAIKQPPKSRAEKIQAAEGFKERNRREILKQQISAAWQKTGN